MFFFVGVDFARGAPDAIEMAFESIDVDRPEPTELFEPGIELLKWSGLEPVEAALRVDSGFDEAGVAKDAEVLGDGRLGHADWRSISPTDCSEEARRLRMARRLGSATISKAFSMRLIYANTYIRVKAYTRKM